jgi:hypothetical protein
VTRGGGARGFAHWKGCFHGGASEQRGNGDGRMEKRWGPPMRWPASSRTSMRCWRRWQLGWKTTDAARRRGSFWWQFRTLAVGSGRVTAASDRFSTAALRQQWGGESRTGRAREARAPHVSGFQFLEKLKNLFPHEKNRYKVRKNLKKSRR